MMETTDQLTRTTRASQMMRSWSLALSVLLGVLLVVLFARSAQIAVGNPPSFDGAMNLQVAESIAAGEGYRRNYAAREVFPHEIQTGPPYIFPTAAVFKLWGVGIPQAEVVSLAYLGLLLILTCWLIVPLGGWPLALFGACTVILIPGIHEYGLYGYGEIPALALALAAITVYFHGKGEVWRGLVAGVLLALAVYTKTVMLIGAGALGLCALLELVAGWRASGRSKWPRFGAFIAGGAGVIVAMEVWRAIVLGGARAWRLWWHVALRNIFAQAGVKRGGAAVVQSHVEKFRIHFGLLGHDYRMSLVLTGLWLALVVAAAVVLAVQWRRRRRRANWTSLVVLLVALVYLAWWLLLTPTAKAWHRRIIDGMICADIGVIMVAAAWLNTRLAGKRLPRVLTVLVPAALAFVLPAMWLIKGTHTLLAAPVSKKICSQYMANPAACARYNPPASVPALQQVAREVRALPANAYVFAFGWYSAPRIGWLARRHILDFHDVPVATLQAGRPVYFVQGSDTPPQSLARIRELYDVSATPDHAYALIRAGSLNPRPLVAGVAPVRRYIEASDHYAYLRGFNKSEGPNGRWLTDDNQALLLPHPGDVFELAAYVLPADKYESHNAPNVIVSFDGCRAPREKTRPNQVDHLVFAIPSDCGIVAGRPVTVRIEVDNLVDSAITADPRALGVLAKSFGFVPAPVPLMTTGVRG